MGQNDTPCVFLTQKPLKFDEKRLKIKE